jgi:hypothetical protein
MKRPRESTIVAGLFVLLLAVLDLFYREPKDEEDEL